MCRSKCSIAELSVGDRRGLWRDSKKFIWHILWGVGGWWYFLLRIYLGKFRKTFSLCHRLLQIWPSNESSKIPKLTLRRFRLRSTQVLSKQNSCWLTMLTNICRWEIRKWLQIQKIWVRERRFEMTLRPAISHCIKRRTVHLEIRLEIPTVACSLAHGTQKPPESLEAYSSCLADSIWFSYASFSIN